MPENKLTDNEVIKALECCSTYHDVTSCKNCPLDDKCEPNMLEQYALDLINRLQAEKNDLFYKLTGVMHSVDKWLDGDELKQDEVNRASTMREKTLQIVENLQAENERLNKEVDRLSQCVLYEDKIAEETTEQKNNIKFKTGDYAKIAKNVSAHRFEIGTIVKLEKCEDNYKAFADGVMWWVTDNDLTEIDNDNLLKELVGEDKC